MKFIDLTGQRFGKLVVLRRSTTRKHVYWICKCDCGNEKQVFGGCLVRGDHQSCGCNRHNNGEMFKKRPYESLYNMMMYNAKKTLEHTITYEEFVEFTFVKECHYCGSGISWTAFNLSWYGGRYNLDRKDNSLGYTKGNCVVCCKRCNRSKSDAFTYAQWKMIGNLMKRNKKKFRS